MRRMGRKKIRKGRKEILEGRYGGGRKYGKGRKDGGRRKYGEGGMEEDGNNIREREGGKK